MILKIFLLILIMVITSYIIVLTYKKYINMECFEQPATVPATVSQTVPATVSQTVPPSVAALPQVIFYEECNYQGRSFTVRTDSIFALNTSSTFKFRSVRIPIGYKVHIYEDNIANISDNIRSDLLLQNNNSCIAESFYNKMSMVKVESIYRNIIPVITFPYCNYNGIAKEYGLGRHDKTADIKSILVPLGYKVEMYINQDLWKTFYDNVSCILESTNAVTSLDIKLVDYVQLNEYSSNIADLQFDESSNLYMIDLDGKMVPKYDIMGSDLLMRYNTGYLNASNHFYPESEFNDIFDSYRNSDKSLDLSMYEQSVQMLLQSHMYNDRMNIDDPISDAYLPYSSNVFLSRHKSPEEANHEYIIINVFKNILHRNPSASELVRYTAEMSNNEIDEHLLRAQLLNTTEYRRNVKLQSNDVFSDLEYSYAKEDILSYITKVYFEETGQDVKKPVLLPLRDIYVYLQNNEYLFRAFILHRNYPLFENEIIETKLLTKSALAEIFNRYFLLYDLKVMANTIKRSHVVDRNSQRPSTVDSYSTPSSLHTASLNAAYQNQDSSKFFDTIAGGDRFLDIADLKRFWKMQ